MRPSSSIGAAILGAALLAGPALADPASADPAETAKAAGEGVSWLFIQTAGAVAFDGATLTLTDVGPSVVMFSDRPARVAEAIPTATFLASWDQVGEGSFQFARPGTGPAAPCWVREGANPTCSCLPLQ